MISCLRMLVLRLIGLFRKGRLEKELDEELRSHLDMQVEENVRKGMLPKEARYAALRSFGGVEQAKEVYRQQRGLPVIETVIQDLRYAMRMLRNNPGFTAVAVLTLALGIGANTAIFSIVNAVMLRPLPFPAADRLVRVISTDLHANTGDNASYPDIVDWRARNHVFDGMAAFRSSNFTLAGEGEPLHLRRAIVSADFFSVLGEAPFLGRSFLPEEDKPGALHGSNAVILSHGLWQRRFGSDRNVWGRTINGGSFTVIGVMREGFEFPIQSEPVELWTTLAVYAQTRNVAPMTSLRGVHFLNVIARLKPDVTVAQAQAEMSAIVSALNNQYPENRPRAARVIPELEQLMEEVRPALRVFLGAVGCVLLIACANVANLQLARATVRQKEISIRAALGASRGRVIRQVLTESILLALFGGSLGLLLGLWGTETLIQFGPQDVPRLKQVKLDGYVFGFTALVSLLTGILFGLIAALHACKPDLVEALKEGGSRVSDGTQRGRIRPVLVVGEVAVALMLLVGAGLLIQSFLRLERVDPGFAPHHVLSFRLDSPPGYSNTQQLDFFQRVLERIRSVPGVRAASGIFGLPFSAIDISTGFEVEGRLTARADRPQTDYMAIEPDYFRTMGIPLRSGRDFTLRDDLKSTPVAIINETVVRRFFSDQDPIGKHIKPQVSNGYDDAPMRQIVGVVGDVKKGSLAAESKIQIYVPLAQSPLGLMTVVLRTGPTPESLIGDMRATVVGLHRDLPIYDVKTLDQYLTLSIAQSRFNTLLLSIFAGLALVLAAVGLYGVMAYSVAQRTQEIGVRIALGANQRDVLRLIVGQGLVLALIGVGIGLAAAFSLTRFLSSLLYGIHPTDPLTFAFVALGLLGVAGFASYLPARRATKVDPMAALRRG